MPPAHVTLWTASTAVAGSATPWLSESERARAASYRRAVDCDRFTVGAALVRLAVARHTGGDPRGAVIDRTCLECGRPHGRPTATASGLALSVSHAGAMVVVAASTDAVAVGVDIEQVPARIEAGVIDLALDLGEQQWVAAGGVDGDSSPEQRFTRLWTLKEAAVKATGDGLRAALPEVIFSATDPGRWRLAGYPDGLGVEPMSLAAIPAAMLANAQLVGSVAAIGADVVLLDHRDAASALGALRAGRPKLPGAEGDGSGNR